MLKSAGRTAGIWAAGAICAALASGCAGLFGAPASTTASASSTTSPAPSAPSAPAAAAPAPRVVTIGTAGDAAASAPSAAAGLKTESPNCPSTQARFLTCANGVRLVTYESGFDLPRYCGPVQALAAKGGALDRARPLQPLPGGERAILTGDAGWLVLPPDPGILDVPSSMAAWWTNRACLLPSAIANPR